MFDIEVSSAVVAGLRGIWAYSVSVVAVYVALRLCGYRAYCCRWGLPASWRDVVALSAVGALIVLAAPLSLAVIVVRHAPHSADVVGPYEEFP